MQNSGEYVVVKATASALSGMLVEPGQWWKVYGDTSKRVLEVDGYKVTETQINVSRAALARPIGEHIVAFMAENPTFQGIGGIKARKLWRTFGVSLYEHLDVKNVAELAKVLTKESAEHAVRAWAKYGDNCTLHWLQVNGFDPAIARNVLNFFGPETLKKLEQDPYRLLSFCGTWLHTDALARNHFKVAEDDPRRLQAAIEEASYRFFATGHTLVRSDKLLNAIQGVLGTQTKNFHWRNLISNLHSQGLSNGSYVVGPNGVQLLGAMVMECQVAKAVVERVNASLLPILATKSINQLLQAYEKTEGIELNYEQQNAVHLAAANPFVLITGSAGVGKTTVLKALYKVYDRAGINITQLALAGRAAKRMQEANGRHASTIANFLLRFREGSFDKRSVVVVDEASMVDVITMSQLCELLGPEPRIVLVGDPAQLMPVGPGLVLHALTKVPQVPLAKLSVVKRYGSVIAAAAASIRDGRWPELSSDPEEAIAFITCPTHPSTTDDTYIAETVLRLYRHDPANSQVLCARRNGADGAKSINTLFQSMLTADAKAVQVWDEQHGAYARVGFHLGDQVLCTRNLWDSGLRNGSLGVVVEVDDKPCVLAHEDGEETDLALGWVLWDDGVRRRLSKKMLDNLELGYAITVHKAQGSQWQRVIVPVTGHRLLDRTLVYTAITRAQRQVLLVGDETAAKSAVEGLPIAATRQVALHLHVTRLLSQDKSVNAQLIAH